MKERDDTFFNTVNDGVGKFRDSIAVQILIAY
ncbi:hypothetical protein KL86PLE_40637 [uncultured Pleomorphomonas sp.]|uniref:Uncharacterized protein n=1 Tax=uncultured Pleomorphomonas sp. TaxID=442121 RepID=A0A212LGZ9_9HYPH|nr:hypothetical protein KL86PLE_40637 [uncultured Pleomorphomonas sp.]